MSDKDKKNSTSFKPGQSGNPGGRSPRVGPNGETWTQLLRTRTVEHEQRLHELCMHTDPDISLKALSMWAPHAWGSVKPASDGSEKPDLAAVIAELISKLPS